MLLLLRSSTYHFRTKIPIDLTDLLQRKELKKSLRTGSKREANRLARLHAATAERMYAQLRLGKETMNEQQLRRLTDKLLADFLQGVERPRQTGTELHELGGSTYPEGYDPNSPRALDALHYTLSSQKTEEQLDSVGQYHRQRIEALRKELRLGQWSEQTRNTTRRLVQENRLDIPLPSPSWFIPAWQAGPVDLDESESAPATSEAAKGAKKFKPAELMIVSTWDDKPPAEFAALCRSVVQTLLEGHGVELERIDGNYATP